MNALRWGEGAMRDQGRRAIQGRDRRRRIALLAALMLVVGSLSFVLGLLVGGGNEVPVTVAAASASTSSTPSSGTSLTSPTVAPTSAGSTSPGTEPGEVLPDGRYFVYATEVTTSGGQDFLTFDLAYFLTGDAADEAAADHGQEVPVPGGIFIVNDDPGLRRLPVSGTVVVRYIPEANCCKLQPGFFDPWAGAVNETLATDYPGKDAPYWITVLGGEIVRIEQQYLA